MEEKKSEIIEQVKFNNKHKGSQFDLICLKSLLEREDVKDTIFKSQKNNFYILLLFTTGEGLHTIDFTDYSYRKGTILTIRKDQIHKFHKSDAEGYVLLFTDEFLLQYIERTEVLKSLRLFNDLIISPKTELGHDDYDEILSNIKEIEKEYFSIDDNYSLDIIRNLLHILFQKLFRIKFEQHQIITGKKYLPEFVELQHLIEKNCHKFKQVQWYAEQMAVSTKTLNNITQEIIHKSAKRFIDEILIIHIERLLINTPLSVKEIAYKVGFEDPSNLYKFFKRFTSSTPEMFRKSN
ncbi:MAG: helix-turn-helix transcriptional regulator [Bacteroidales bacterium]